MSERRPVRLFVNGEEVRREVTGREFLLEFLRDQLGLTGAKEGCGIGVCGLCTVLVDGVAVSSCLLPVACVEGRQVWTLEGLTALPERRAGGPLPPGAPDGELMREVQAAFLECEGLQCGICTPGQVMAAYALLAENPQPDEETIRHFLAGNLCRCTGYGGIVRAVQRAAERWAARHAAP